MTDNAPHLKGTRVWGKGRFRELGEDGTAKGTKKGGSSHELGDAGSLVWRAERNQSTQGRRMVWHRVQRANNEPSKGVSHKGDRFSFGGSRHEVCKSQRYLLKGEFTRWILKRLHIDLGKKFP
jgi:hypothetical protein